MIVGMASHPSVVVDFLQIGTDSRDFDVDTLVRRSKVYIQPERSLGRAVGLPRGTFRRTIRCRHELKLALTQFSLGGHDRILPLLVLAVCGTMPDARRSPNRSVNGRTQSSSSSFNEQKYPYVRETTQGITREQKFRKNDFTSTFWKIEESLRLFGT